MTIQRFRIPPIVAGAKFRVGSDGAGYLEFDDAYGAQAVEAFDQTAIRFRAQCEAWLGVAQAAPPPAQVIGTSPLTIKPPVVAPGIGGGFNVPNIGGGTNAPGIRPPPPPPVGGAAGLGAAGTQSNAAPIPGVPVMPQPAIAAPPPVPNLRPGAAAPASAVIGSVFGTPAAASPSTGAGSTRIRSAMGTGPAAKFIPPEVVRAKIAEDWAAEGPPISKETGKPIASPAMQPLPQPPVMAPPPPPQVTSAPVEQTPHEPTP